MTYNPHQNSTLKGDIPRIMRKLQVMHSYLARTHFMHISHLISKQKFSLLAKQETNH